METLTFADLTTVAGATVAGALVTALVEILKKAIPELGNRVSGALLAFIASAALYVATGLALMPGNPDGWLLILIAWINCATVAMGIHGLASHVQEVRAGTAGPTTVIGPSPEG